MTNRRAIALALLALPLAITAGEMQAAEGARKIVEIEVTGIT